LLSGNETVDERPQLVRDRVPEHAGRKVWNRDDHPGRIPLDGQLRTPGVEHRLLEKKDAPLLRASGEQLLRTLKDEIPTEMGKADEVSLRHKRTGART
jgi:hypothetical protein